MSLFLLFFLSILQFTVATNFDWENIQLDRSEASSYPAIRFADQPLVTPRSTCKTIPRDAEWPSEAEWARFNDTLDGVLLRPRPLATPCYEGEEYNSTRCEELQRTWANMALHSNHPISIASQWASGNTCVPTSQPNSTCTQGGWPVYVVKATTVRHVQLAVNFARNNNIRFVIKTSGHDFNGKSIGGHALSIWTYSLRSLTYHPNYTTPSYTGRALAIGAGIRSTDGSAAMAANNSTMIIAGGPAVGLAGGFMQGGGHSIYASYYGLAADHVLSIQAVLASGEFVTINEEENVDLFWAFRGGGGSTFGVITSLVFRVFPRTPTVSSSITFSTLPRGNDTGLHVDVFWAGVKEYFGYCIAICDAGGIGYNFIRHTTTGDETGLTFTTSITLPNRSTQDLRAFVRPLLIRLNDLGIPVPLPPVQSNIDPFLQDDLPQHFPNALNPRALGDTVSQTLIASRFFSRANHASDSAISTMNEAIRALVEEGGFTFHGINHNPNLNVSGHPDNAVNPAFRNAILHAQGYEGNLHWDGKDVVGGRREWGKRHEKLQRYMQKWRDITPGSGSYINEGDAQDPSWKSAFFGGNYPRLLAIKHFRDPWGVFWAIGAVGHDEWKIRSTSGEEQGSLVMQDGRLCRAGG